LAGNHLFPHRYHTIGALARYDPLDWLYVQLGVTDAEGNYRFDLCHDGSSLARHDGRGTESDLIRFGVSFGQMMTDRLGAFLRYGTDDGRVRKFSQYGSLGGTWKGPLEERSDDVLGFGVGQGLAGIDYRRAKGTAHTETIFELYYMMQLRQFVSLTLDCRVLSNPGTQSETETAVIPGVRLKFVF
jgi:hypothetical protein